MVVDELVLLLVVLIAIEGKINSFNARCSITKKLLQEDPKGVLYLYKIELSLCVHRNKKLFVVLGLFNTVINEFHSLYRIHVCQILSKHPHAL